jgi:hypothetical protein
LPKKEKKAERRKKPEANKEIGEGVAALEIQLTHMTSAKSSSRLLFWRAFPF